MATPEENIIMNGGTISPSDNAYYFKTVPGKRYAFDLCGDFAGASVTIGPCHSNAASGSNETIYPDSPLTAAGGFEFVATAPYIYMISTGGTGDAIVFHCHPIYP